MEFSTKEMFTMGVSTLGVMVLTYYFVPGADSLSTTLWYGIANLAVEIFAAVLVNNFFV